MMIVAVPYYAIPRNDADEDERQDEQFSYLVGKAMRWWPEHLNMDELDFAKGASALRSLAQGDAISECRLQLAIGYLIDAIAFYNQSEWEPWAGRNTMARDELQAVLEEINIYATQEVTA